jgi:hypothetical protein
VRTAHAASIDTGKLASRLRLRCDGDHKNALLRVSSTSLRASREQNAPHPSVFIRHHAEGGLPEAREPFIVHSAVWSDPEGFGLG